MIKVRMRKAWFWRGAWLREGATYNVTKEQAEMLERVSAADIVPEVAVVGAEERAVLPRPEVKRGRPPRKKHQADN